MPKKNFSFCEQESMLDSIVGWKTPKFHQASECYVSISAWDPSLEKFRTKKIMLGHVKGKREQRKYGEHLIQKLTEKLMNGWNPWVEQLQPKQYSRFDEVCEQYEVYLFKLLKEGSMREESVTSYVSRLRMLRKWKEDNKINLTYIYQFDSSKVSAFLDYIFIDRNNTLRTRNNYLGWIKTFCKYLLQRKFVNLDPSQSLSVIKKRGTGKNREVIPDDLMLKIKGWLEKNNRHFLLACYILHYLFVRPREMSFLKIGDFSIKKKTLNLHGCNTKNGNDAVLTVPDHVLKLMIELDVFKSPGSYFLFSEGFMPGPKRRSEKSFRDFWGRDLRRALNLDVRYKFYSLKDTGITNMLRANTDILSVRDQARHSSILITDIYTPRDIKNANKLILNYHGIL